MSENTQIVEPGKFVAFAYKLYDQNTADKIYETPADAPDVMVYGVSHEIVPGLAEAMKGLKAGDRFGVILPPAAAFGERNPEYILELDRDVFMRDGKLADEVKVGARLPMMTAEGYRVEGIVTEVGDKIKMDFNHPFAGLEVKYEGEIVEVRDATPDELRPTGGCCCSGGGCGSDGCGDGCGSGCCGSEGDARN